MSILNVNQINTLSGINTLTVNADIKILGATSGSVSLKSPAVVTGGDISLTLPDGVGSAGQYLRNSGTAGTLEFGALGSSDMPTGSILQVVHGATSTLVDVTTSTYTDTGLTASITPTSSSNKILVLVTQQVYCTRDVDGHGAGVKVLRGSTSIYDPIEDSNGPWDAYDGTGRSFSHRITLNLLDSPASTSTLTYKTQGRPYTSADSGRARFQQSATPQNATSFMTLIEVAA